MLLAALISFSLPAHLLIWNSLPAAGLFGALILAPVIPVLFELTERNRVDRFIGDLSYGTYVSTTRSWFFFSANSHRCRPS